MPQSNDAGGWRSLLVRMGCIVLCSATLAVGANTLGSRRIDWVERWSERVEAKAIEEGIALVDVDEARKRVDAERQVIFDARAASDFEAGHLPKAISLPGSSLDEVFPNVQLLLRPDTPILVYCSGKSCDESLLVARFLHEQGYRNVSLFAAGFEAWRQKGFPVELGQ